MGAARTGHLLARLFVLVWLTLTAAGCDAASTSHPVPSPSGHQGKGLGDCEAVRLLVAAQQRVPALENALSSNVAPQQVWEAADAVIEPIKPVLSSYGGSIEPGDAVAAAIQTAVWDLAESAGFFERQTLPGTSAPASGLGSRAWALGELTRATDEVSAALAIVASGTTSPGACP